MRPSEAIARRDLVRYFTSPTGYVFITVFIFLGAAAQFWQSGFFSNNLANLALLNDKFPLLLIFFIPAVAMGSWADERRQGTEELLLTLPVKDSDLVIGKYLAALGIYAISLVFSISHVCVLAYLGKPDIGLMLGTYLGYFFLGAALLPIAMIGSLVAESATVAFILGAVLCAIPVGWSWIGGLVGDRVAAAGIQGPFLDFSQGVVSLKGLAYFVLMTVVGLAVNFYLLHRRRISQGTWHLPVRALCLAVAAASLIVLAGRTPVRTDLTAEKLHTLTKQTRDVLRSVPAERPVYIQAYISPDVPQNYVDTRESLVAALRDFDAIGGDNVVVKINDTVRASDAAREADEKYGIKAEKIVGDRGAGSVTMDVFMGISFTAGPEEFVIPFMYRGLGVEYELTRSLRVVLKSKRYKIGILATELKIMGGGGGQYDPRASGPWDVVAELKKQYEVVGVTPADLAKDTCDAMIVPMASSLAPDALDLLKAYVLQGKPTLFLEDSYPTFNPPIGPNEAGSPRNMMGAPPEPKGKFREFYRSIGLTWEPGEIAYDHYNPLPPPYDDLEPEFVFVGKGAEGKEPFSNSSATTSGLQNLVVILSGRVRNANVAGITFTELLKAGRRSGIVQYSDVSGNPQFRPPPKRLPSGEPPVLAASVEGTIKEGGKETNVNAILVCDIDFMGPLFFRMRKQGEEIFNFDNITFLLNCVDDLAGDTGFIEVRKRRPRHRTLEKLEALKATHREKALAATKSAEEKAEKELKEAQDRFDAKIKELAERTDLDDYAKSTQAKAIHEVENRRLEVARQRIKDDKEGAIAKSESARDREIRSIQDGIRLLAMVLPPIPALFIALIALYFRVRRELEARR